MRFLFVLSLCVGLTTAVSITETNSNSYDHYRLPTAVRPIRYHLRILTELENPDNLFFTGDVKIDLDVLEEAKNITLHARNLTIDSAKITIGELNSDQRKSIRSTEENSKHNYFIIHLEERLNKHQKYQLRIPFSAELNRKLHGYYRSSYTDKATNETRWLSTTQFEPAAARVAFPCFDEPDLKAKFTITLGHHKKYNALSNMPVKETKPITDHEDYVWSIFEESVPMSTYLVAYTINDFAFKPSNTNLKNEVTFRTWARPSAIDQCSYAAEVGPKVLQYYENIFGIKFPLKKIDQIAIPDFSSGAMENWGMVTYRETALLFAENVSSFADKQRVASVVAHELAHQWFGNLVTMKWWTDLWLNEGFATYVASLGVEHISPEWKSLEEESVDNMLSIFKVDALKTSHPISQPIQLASEIFEIFDSISYKKGSTVLRMMHNFLGDESFRTGLTDYLQKYSYRNAEQDNLWSTLTEAAHKYRSLPDAYNIKKIMDSWTLQTGYPIVSITRNYEARSAQISQMRYLLDPEASRTENANCWWVPLSFTSERQGDFNNTASRDWLECHESGESITKSIEQMPQANEWVIFNIQMTGLYKVKYDERNWNMLIETLMTGDFERIHIINRAQLIDAALSLAWSGDQDYDIAMRLIEYLEREREYIPWKAALENLSNVNRILRQTPDYEFFKRYMRKILTPIYKHLNGLNDTFADLQQQNGILHKVLIASWSCRFEVEDCVPQAIKYFNQWRSISNPDEKNPIPKDLRSVVYCTSIRYGSDDDWEFLWQRYKNSNVAAEKKIILSSLGCSREVWLLQRYLGWTFDANDIRKQDSSIAFSAVARGEVGFHLAKDFFLANIEFLHNFYEPDTSDLNRLLQPLSSQIISKHDYEHLKIFVQQNKKFLARTEQGVRRALETIHINAEWKERNYGNLTRLLQERLFKA